MMYVCERAMCVFGGWFVGAYVCVVGDVCVCVCVCVWWVICVYTVDGGGLINVGGSL